MLQGLHLLSLKRGSVKTASGVKQLGYNTGIKTRRPNIVTQLHAMPKKQKQPIPQPRNGIARLNQILKRFH